jgi:hypothetical protein
MATESTLTVILGGEVPLDQFAEGMQRFWRLINALSQEVSGKAKVSWVVDELAGAARWQPFGRVRTNRGCRTGGAGICHRGQALERHQVIPTRRGLPMQPEA